VKSATLLLCALFAALLSTASCSSARQKQSLPGLKLAVKLPIDPLGRKDYEILRTAVGEAVVVKEWTLFSLPSYRVGTKLPTRKVLPGVFGHVRSGRIGGPKGYPPRRGVRNLADFTTEYVRIYPDALDKNTYRKIREVPFGYLSTGRDAQPYVDTLGFYIGAQWRALRLAIFGYVPALAGTILVYDRATALGMARRAATYHAIASVPRADAMIRTVVHTQCRERSICLGLSSKTTCRVRITGLAVRIKTEPAP
jgi:hypothetical protein